MSKSTEIRVLQKGLQKFQYSRWSEFVIVSVPYSVLFTIPFFSLTFRSVKHTEPLILTVRFLVFGREPYRTKMRTVIRLVLRTTNRTKWGTVIRLLLGTANRTAPKLVRYGSRCCSRSSMING